MFIFPFGKCSTKHSIAGLSCSEIKKTGSNLGKVLQYGEETDTDIVWNCLQELSYRCSRQKFHLLFMKYIN